MSKYLLLLTLSCLFLNSSAQTTNSASPSSQVKKAKPVAKKKKKPSKNDREDADKLKRNGTIKKPDVVTKATPMHAPIRRNGKQVTGNISNVQGFRICIYNGTVREDAFKTKRQFMMADAKTLSYLSYSRPYYRIKIGDFTDKKTAQRTLKKMQTAYPNAFIVPDIVVDKNIEVRRISKQRSNPR